MGRDGRTDHRNAQPFTIGHTLGVITRGFDVELNKVHLGSKK
jgi:hypothetical protein